jgi:hypothetical protein
VSIASSIGTPLESETESFLVPPSQTDDPYGDDQLDHDGEIDEWEHKDQTAKERNPDRPNPCTLSGWELLFEFGVIEPTVRMRSRHSPRCARCRHNTGRVRVRPPSETGVRLCCGVGSGGTRCAGT